MSKKKKLPIPKTKEEHDSNVVELFKGWTPVAEGDELLIKYKKTGHVVKLPSGLGVGMFQGKYSTIPIIIVGGGDIGERMFMRAHGINRKNRKANEVRLKSLIKALAKDLPKLEG